MKQLTKIAIALGSNLGDRSQMIAKASKRIEEEFLEEAKLSSLYETPPWGMTDQPRYYNAVITGLSEWKPPAIVNYLKRLEMELGRTSTVRNGPRLIDLDLLAYGEGVWESEGVSVPHPRMMEREFVLAPLVEIWPDWVHPVVHRTASQLLSELLKREPSTAVKL